MSPPATCLWHNLAMQVVAKRNTICFMRPLCRLTRFNGSWFDVICAVDIDAPTVMGQVPRRLDSHMFLHAALTADIYIYIYCETDMKHGS